jgi:transcriptional regulator with XRE-family HTH domain
VADEGTGQRIARARRRRGLSQAVTAGLVGRSESWLSQVERGLRPVDSYKVLTALAGVLRTDISELTGPSGSEEGLGMYEAAAEIERAMLDYGDAAAAIGGAAGREVSAAHLRGMSGAAYAAYQSGRYGDVGRLLPSLIREAEAAARAPGGTDPDACAARAAAYDVAAALLHRVGEAALAWTAADRAMTAAVQSGVAARAAVAAWRLAHVINGRRHPDEALALAMTAADALKRVPRAGPLHLEALGALHLAAANAAAAADDRATTDAMLSRAREIAGQTGNVNQLGTAFGPVNTTMHAMGTALTFGDARSAVEAGESLDPDALPPGCTGRRAQVLLDLARAYSMRKQDAAAVNMLLAAERLSPDLVRYDSATCDVLSALMRREHRPSTPELRPLARRAGVI